MTNFRRDPWRGAVAVILPFLSGALGAVIGFCFPQIPFYLGARPPDPAVAHGPIYVGLGLAAVGAFVGLGVGLWGAYRLMRGHDDRSPDGATRDEDGFDELMASI